MAEPRPQSVPLTLFEGFTSGSRATAASEAPRTILRRAGLPAQPEGWGRTLLTQSSLHALIPRTRKAKGRPRGPGPSYCLPAVSGASAEPPRDPKVRYHPLLNSFPSSFTPWSSWNKGPGMQESEGNALGKSPSWRVRDEPVTQGPAKPGTTPGQEAGRWTLWVTKAAR